MCKSNCNPIGTPIPNVQVIDPDVAKFYKLMEKPVPEHYAEGLMKGDSDLTCTEIMHEDGINTLSKFYTVSPGKREPIPEMTEETKAKFDDWMGPGVTIGEPTKPNYYKFNIKGIQCNMFDIARALGLSLELFSALKYFRVKGDTAKRINDLQKAKQCIDMEIEELRRQTI